MQKMQVKRVGHELIYDEYYLYAIGGRTHSNTCTRLCERYNFKTNSWEFVEPMKNARARPAVCKN